MLLNNIYLGVGVELMTWTKEKVEHVLARGFSLGLKPGCDWLHVAGAVGRRGLTAESWTEGLAPVFEGPADGCWRTRQQWKTDHLQRLPALLRSTIKFSPTINVESELKTCTSRSNQHLKSFISHLFAFLIFMKFVCLFVLNVMINVHYIVPLFHYWLMSTIFLWCRCECNEDKIKVYYWVFWSHFLPHILHSQPQNSSCSINIIKLQLWITRLRHLTKVTWQLLHVLKS